MITYTFKPCMACAGLIVSDVKASFTGQEVNFVLDTLIPGRVEHHENCPLVLEQARRREEEMEEAKKKPESSSARQDRLFGSGNGLFG